jgi:hypothetical protein
MNGIVANIKKGNPENLLKTQKGQMKTSTIPADGENLEKRY